MPEKRVPHFDLDAIKLAFSTGEGLFTWTATQDAAALGYGRKEIAAVIGKMDRVQFYKSMTSNYDTAVWQDVYYAPDGGRTLYVKFTDNGSVTEFTLLSFKEK